MSDKNFPASSGDSSKPILVANVSTGPEGPAAVYAYPAGPVVPIPCDNDGSNPVYTSATSDILVYQGGLLLTGWTLAYVTGSGCIGTVNNTVEPRTATIANVTAPSGYADFTATKDGVILNFRVYFSKMPEGATGATGSTGSAGATGAAGSAGPAGSDGTGLIIRKFTANVRDAFASCVASNNGSGNTRLTFGSDPDIEVGEYLTWNAGGFSEEFGSVVTEISPTVYDMDTTFGTSGAVYCWSMRYYRRDGNAFWDQRVQSICLPNILPVGAKLDEVAVLKRDSTLEPLFVDAGYAQYPSSGFDRYISKVFLTTQGQLRQVNLWDPTRYGYSPDMINNNGAAARNFFFYTTQYAELQYWNTLLSTIIFEYFISYKYFPTTYGG